MQLFYFLTYSYPFIPSLILVCTNDLFIKINNKIIGKELIKAEAIKNGISVEACEAVEFKVIIATCTVLIFGSVKYIDGPKKSL